MKPPERGDVVWIDFDPQSVFFGESTEPAQAGNGQ
jgi:mRNA-degrading endonuclease toxin of MazEF toxin-antitoxin module